MKSHKNDVASESHYFILLQLQPIW